ncbi:MAG: site-specific integrase [Bacteroidia bacterium]|nr:site-specific integrase [Bacteroidia bacterium]
MKTTFNLELNSKPKSNGFHDILLRVTHKQKHKRYSLNVSVKATNFNKKAKFGSWIRSTDLEHKSKNEFLKIKIQEAEEVYRELEKDNNDTSSVVVIKLLKQDKNLNFFPFADKIYDQFFATGNIGTARRIKSNVKKLRDYTKNELLFTDINPAFLDDYEQHLKTSYHNSQNTVHANLRTIKAIFRKAVRNNIIGMEKDPFYKYELKPGHPVRDKLDLEEIKKIEELIIKPDSFLWHCRNYFLFSFYCAGIRAGDIMELRWSNIRDGRLVYTMGKTGSHHSIKLIPQAQVILGYYQKSDCLPDDYIFPILNTKFDLSDPRLLFSQKSSKLAMINGVLKELARQINTSKRISFHISRHSFASISKDKNISVEKISELLGHNDIKTTKTYLKGFSNTELDNTMSQIFNEK